MPAQAPPQPLAAVL